MNRPPTLPGLESHSNATSATYNGLARTMPLLTPFHRSDQSFNQAVLGMSGLLAPPTNLSNEVSLRNLSQSNSSMGLSLQLPLNSFSQTETWVQQHSSFMNSMTSPSYNLVNMIGTQQSGQKNLSGSSGDSQTENKISNGLNTEGNGSTVNLETSPKGTNKNPKDLTENRIPGDIPTTTSLSTGAIPTITVCSANTGGMPTAYNTASSSGFGLRIPSTVSHSAVCNTSTVENPIGIQAGRSNTPPPSITPTEQEAINILKDKLSQAQQEKAATQQALEALQQQVMQRMNDFQAQTEAMIVQAQEHQKAAVVEAREQERQAQAKIQEELIQQRQRDQNDIRHLQAQLTQVTNQLHSTGIFSRCNTPDEFARMAQENPSRVPSAPKVPDTAAAVSSPIQGAREALQSHPSSLASGKVGGSSAQERSGTSANEQMLFDMTTRMDEMSKTMQEMATFMIKTHSKPSQPSLSSATSSNFKQSSVGGSYATVPSKVSFADEVRICPSNPTIDLTGEETSTRPAEMTRRRSAYDHDYYDRDTVKSMERIAAIIEVPKLEPANAPLYVAKLQQDIDNSGLDITCIPVKNVLLPRLYRALGETHSMSCKAKTIPEMLSFIDNLKFANYDKFDMIKTLRKDTNHCTISAMYEKAKVHLKAMEPHLKDECLLIGVWDLLVEFIYKGTEAQMAVNVATRPPTNEDLDYLDRHWKALKKISADITTPRGKIHEVSPDDPAEVAVIQHKPTYFGDKSPEQREVDRKAPHDPNGVALCKQVSILMCDSHRNHGLAAFQCDGEPCQFRQFACPHEITYGAWGRAPDLQPLRVQCLAREGIQFSKLREIRDILRERNLLSYENAPRNPQNNRMSGNNGNVSPNQRGFYKPNYNYNNNNRYKNQMNPIQQTPANTNPLPATTPANAVQNQTTSSGSQNFLASGPPVTANNTGGVQTIQPLGGGTMRNIYKKNLPRGPAPSIFLVE